MKKLFMAALLPIMFVGCDPGWKYSRVDIVDQNTNMPLTDDIVTIIEGDLFGTRLDIQIEIINKGVDSLEIDPDLFTVADANNKVLPEVFCSQLDDLDGLFLDPGQSLIHSCRFEVSPIKGLFWSSNRDLKIINVYLDGLARDGKQIPMHFQLQWDLP